MRFVATNTMMHSMDDKRALAPFVLDCLLRAAERQGMTMRGILLIPFKSLATAKQRLAGALNAAQRSQLAEAMLRDVMTAAAGVQDRIDVALVTGDARAQSFAKELGFLVIEDTRNESETAAIEMATAWCEERGYDTTIVVPADIPLIAADELHRVLDAAPQRARFSCPRMTAAAATVSCAGRRRSFRCASATTAFCPTAKPCSEPAKN